jgi:transposase-like protein
MAKITFTEVLRWTDQECLDYLEAQRWPNGIACPRCGVMEPYKVTRKKPSKNGVAYLWKCRGCKEQFTATVGTIFEGSHVPLGKWFAAIFLMCSSKKGHSAHQIHRELDVTYKTAWFMMHRIRSAMEEQGSPFQISGVVEADETYVGGRYRRSPRAERMGAGVRGIPGADSNKVAVFGIIERGGGYVHTEVIDRPTLAAVRPIITEHVDQQHAHLMTDESIVYRRIKLDMPHDVIRHASEYVRGEIHTNTIENYWSVLKRGLYGTYQHVDAGYLPCYLNEFSFRFNRRHITDAERFQRLVGQVDCGPLTWYWKDADEASPEASPE